MISGSNSMFFVLIKLLKRRLLTRCYNFTDRRNPATNPLRAYLAAGIIK